MEVYFHEEKKSKIKNYKRLNKFAPKGQVLFVGSSLMENFPVYELMLVRSSDKLIYNRGIGGYTTLEMLPSLETCIFDLEPSKIFMNIGTNDLNGEDYKVETLIGNYEIIINKIRERLPKAKIYIMAYFPVNIEAARNPWMKEILGFRTNERIVLANMELQKLSSKTGAKFININQNLLDENGCLKKEYSIDGIHMYADGYEAIIDQLLIYVND